MHKTGISLYFPMINGYFTLLLQGGIMKKLNLDKVKLQKKLNISFLKKNLKIANAEKVFRNNSIKLYAKTLRIPGVVSLYKSNLRSEILNVIDEISCADKHLKPVLLDFSAVTSLDAASTSYFVQNINKHSSVKLVGRAPKNKVIHSMITRLNINKRLKIKDNFCVKSKVNKWYIAKGTKTDLIGEYDVIENVLLEKFGGDNEDFYIINEAIAEAVNNVVDHAYVAGDIHREWLVFLGIDSEKCSVVISDLGRTIPDSVPAKITDQGKHIFQQLLKLDLSDWAKIDDASRIQIASNFRRSATELKHRGKGFANMMEVCKQVPNSELYVYSRNGLWWMKQGRKDFKKTYKTPINGTIIYWDIPLNQSLIGQPSFITA